METTSNPLKQTVLSQLENSDNQELFKSIKRLLDYFEPKPITMEEWQERLLSADQALKEGKIVTQSQVETTFTQWKQRLK